MKKVLLISTIVLASVCIANAEPGFNLNVGTAPFQILQREKFEQESAEHWQNVKRGNEEYASEYYNDLDCSEVEHLKQKPQINLNGTKTPQMTEENGVVKIEYK